MAKKAANALCWFEIPAKKIARAKKFYETMLGGKLATMSMGDCTYAMFPTGDGALVEGNGAAPSTKGTMVYFDCSPDLAKAQGRVAKAGGKVLQKKFSIGEHGFCAIIQDTEGNRIGIHSMK